MSARLRSRTALAIFVTALVSTGCEVPRFGMPDSATTEGQGIQRLWSGFFITAAAVALLVYVLLIFVLIRYRRRPHDGDELPSQSGYNIPLEIVYTAIPIAMVIVLFAFSTVVQRDVDEVRDDADVKVEVIGFQWGWQFRYDDEGFTIEAPPGESPQMVLPLGEPAQLQLVSADVAHSFWVVDFNAKRDLIPGVDNVMEVTPRRTGTFVGRCAEFCGLDHWRMDFSVRVVPPDEYQRWLTEQTEAGP